LDCRLLSGCRHFRFCGRDLVGIPFGNLLLAHELRHGSGKTGGVKGCRECGHGKGGQRDDAVFCFHGFILFVCGY